VPPERAADTGNVHIYENNIANTERLLDGDETVKFELNVWQDVSFISGRKILTY